jgi:5-methylcytosine-specific restriction endonuclease McrA
VIGLPVLVLNQNYQPLNVCQVKRAIILLLYGKAEVIENGRGVLHSMNGIFDIPSVIRLIYFISRPNQQRKMTKMEIFNRDKYICQYCGSHSRELTLDHVIPRYRGGGHTWENVVSACIPCNRKKAGRLPLEAGMPLLHKPKPPKYDGFHIPYHYVRTHLEWQKYLPQ